MGTVSDRNKCLC